MEKKCRIYVNAIGYLYLNTEKCMHIYQAMISFTVNYIDVSSKETVLQKYCKNGNFLPFIRETSLWKS